jgi:hypothetical protein
MKQSKGVWIDGFLILREWAELVSPFCKRRMSLADWWGGREVFIAMGQDLLIINW